MLFNETILHQPQRLDNGKQDRLLHIPSIYITSLRKAINYLCFEAKKHIDMGRDWSLTVRIYVIITRVNADSQYKTYYILKLFLFQKKGNTRITYK